MKRRKKVNKRGNAKRHDFSDYALQQARLQLLSLPLGPATRRERGRLLTDIASVYWHRAEYEEALNVWYQALAIAEQEKDLNLLGLTYCVIATTYVHAGDYQAGIENAQKGLSYTPDNPGLLFAIGNAHMFAGNDEIAFRWWHQSIEIDPNFHIAYEHIGSLHYRRREYEMAERYLQQALEMDPLSNVGLNELGNMYLTLKRFDEALGLFRTAIRTHPDNPTAYNNIGNCYFKMGNLDQARRFYERRVKMCPEDALWANIGLGLMQRARADGRGRGKSERYFQRALEIHKTKRAHLLAMPLDHEALRAIALVGLDDPEAVSAWQTILTSPDLKQVGEGSVADWHLSLKFLLNSPDPPTCTAEILEMIAQLNP